MFFNAEEHFIGFVLELSLVKIQRVGDVGNLFHSFLHVLVLGEDFWVVVSVQFFHTFALTVNYRVKAQPAQIGIYPARVNSVLSVVSAENLR